MSNCRELFELLEIVNSWLRDKDFDLEQIRMYINLNRFISEQTRKYDSPDYYYTVEIGYLEDDERSELQEYLREFYTHIKVSDYDY